MSKFKTFVRQLQFRTLYKNLILKHIKERMLVMYQPNINKSMVNTDITGRECIVLYPGSSWYGKKAVIRTPKPALEQLRVRFPDGSENEFNYNYIHLLPKSVSELQAEREMYAKALRNVEEKIKIMEEKGWKEYSEDRVVAASLAGKLKDLSEKDAEEELFRIISQKNK